MRVALYWTPEPGDPLAQAGNAWLGRDPEHGVARPQPDIAGLQAATAAPRLYGFHATLRPPMRLSTGWKPFMAAVRSLAAGIAPFPLPALAVQDFGGFLALRETRLCLDLQALADACVRVTDPHRHPPDPAELARRRQSALTREQDALLLRWGYPHVMRHWHFHMTLTGRLDAAEMARLRPLAEAHFAPALRHERSVRELAVFTQKEGLAPFLVAERVRLLGEEGLLS